MMDPASLQEAKYKTQAFFAIARDTFEAGFAKIRREESAAFDVAIIKSTLQNDAVPKEKHVQALIQACNAAGEVDSATYVINGLAKRLADGPKSWLVTLKALIVFHRLFREAYATFRDKLLSYADGTGQADMFRLYESFNDDNTSDTLAHSVMIRCYSVYLDERLAAYRWLRFDPKRDTDAEAQDAKLKSFPAKELLALLPTAQRLLAALFDCVPQGPATAHEVPLLASRLVLEELSTVYDFCCQGVKNLIAKTAELRDPDDAVKVVITIQEAVKLNARLESYEQSVNATPALQGIVQFPSKQPWAEDILPNVEAYLQDPYKPQADGDGPEKTGPSVADLLGFQSFAISQPRAADPAAADAVVTAPAAAPAPTATAAPTAVGAAVDIFSSFSTPAPEQKPQPEAPKDPLDVLASLVVTPTPPAAAAGAAPSAPQETQGPAKQFTFGEDDPFAASKGGAGAGGHPPAAAAVAAAAVADAPVDAAKPPPAAAPANVAPGAAPPAPEAAAKPSPPAKYTLKEPDPLDYISKELFDKQPAPPPMPMKAAAGREGSPADGDKGDAGC